jgi:predicted dinucleotide-binding enzyme
VQPFLQEDLPEVDRLHSTSVVGDDAEAVATTIALVKTIPGFKGLKAGPLENSKIVELLGPPWLVLQRLNFSAKKFADWKFEL